MPHLAKQHNHLIILQETLHKLTHSFISSDNLFLSRHVCCFELINFIFNSIHMSSFFLIQHLIFTCSQTLCGLHLHHSPLIWSFERKWFRSTSDEIIQLMSILRFIFRKQVSDYVYKHTSSHIYVM